MKNFWLFFYSLPNILGLAGLFLGLLAQIALLVSASNGLLAWWLVIPACYVFGWLLGFIVQKKEAQLQFQQHLTAEEITEQLTKLLKKVKNRISPEAYVHLQSIQTSVQSVLPHLVAGQFGNQELFTIKQTVFDYLPTTLENYLKLPPAYTAIHVIQDGKTAKVLLNEQLALIDNTMQKVVHNIVSDDAQALLVNQRFLQSRLEQQDFLH